MLIFCSNFFFFLSIFSLLERVGNASVGELLLRPMVFARVYVCVCVWLWRVECVVIGDMVNQFLVHLLCVYNCMCRM